ncbi:Hypothetical predicted protein [Olea europaea subsp. europaea]|uniref:Uncharacterized protein n=1 Tax=Olea europaea subsp. europaea TaxID=158383 RepID=A0A8S0SWF4_OLEEU|nr:Hypothetical predicted protein [Olea europaea subsp. europaea]
MELEFPSRFSIFFKLLGVMNSLFSIAYILNASFNSSFLSSSPPPNTSFVKSSGPNIPSLSESENCTTISASSSDISPPKVLTHRRSSCFEILPSPFSSKYLKTISFSLHLSTAGASPFSSSELEIDGFRSTDADFLGDNFWRNRWKADFGEDWGFSTPFSGELYDVVREGTTVSSFLTVMSN